MQEDILQQGTSGTEMTEEEKKLAFAPIPKLLLSYAVPSIISMIVMSIYNLVDQIFIGNSVGYLGNGATNIIYPLTLACLTIASLLSNGGAAFCSLRLGEQKYDDARKTIGTAIIMTAISVTTLVVLSFIFLEPICRLFGCTDEILPYALKYGRFVLPGMPFATVSVAISAFIRTDGSPKYAMIVMLSGAVLNCILDPIFIFVFKMGVIGAAIATVISQLLGFTLTICYLPRFKIVKMRAKDYVPNGKILGKICTLGLSSAVTQAAAIVIVGLINNAFVKYGAMTKYGSSIPLTAMGITSKVTHIVTSIAGGTATGAQPIFGYNYGARNIPRVKKTFKVALLIIVVFMLLGAILAEIFPQKIVRLFGAESDLYNEFAVICIRVFMMMVIFNGIQQLITTFFQAIGKPGRSLLLSALRQIVLLIPAILILPLFFGLNGALLAVPVSDILAFFISFFFMSSIWKHLEKEQLTL